MVGDDGAVMWWCPIKHLLHVWHFNCGICEETRERLHQIPTQWSLGSMLLLWTILCFIVEILDGSWNRSDSDSNSASATYWLEQWGPIPRLWNHSNLSCKQESQLRLLWGSGEPAHTKYQHRAWSTASVQSLNSFFLFQLSIAGKQTILRKWPQGLCPFAMRALVNFTWVTTRYLLKVLQPRLGSGEWLFCWPNLESFMHSCFLLGDAAGARNPGWPHSHVKYLVWDGWNS